MADARYEEPVAGLADKDLAARMQLAIQAAVDLFPKGTGVAVFTFDMGQPTGGGFGWICNGHRGDMIRALLAWIQHQRRRSRWPIPTLPPSISGALSK